MTGSRSLKSRHSNIPRMPILSFPSMANIRSVPDSARRLVIHRKTLQYRHCVFIRFDGKQAAAARKYRAQRGSVAAEIRGESAASVALKTQLTIVTRRMAGSATARPAKKPPRAMPCQFDRRDAPLLTFNSAAIEPIDRWKTSFGRNRPRSAGLLEHQCGGSISTSRTTCSPRAPRSKILRAGHQTFQRAAGSSSLQGHPRVISSPIKICSR